MGRERWSSRKTFVLAAIGSAVGLGNAWRFPGMAYNNGGGAFLIPYFVAMLAAGIPLLMLELTIGKKYQGGAPQALRQMSKKFEPLGWFSIATSFVIITYYAVVVAWVLDYIYYSFVVPWAGMEGGASAFFFGGDILGLSGGPGEFGTFSGPVLIGLVVAWIAIWWCLRNGIKSVEKVIKWTVFLPLALLVILAIRGLTLPGGVEGINYLLTPDFTRLGDIGVWAAAFGQVFFSYSILFGIMIAYSSYLPKETDVPSNALVIGFADSLISFVAGFAVFSILGFMSQSTGTPIAEMGHMGVGLAFATYPEAMSMLPGGVIVAAVFAVMFFIMLFTLGIDSAFSIVEGVVTAVTDKFKTNRRKTLTTVCVIGFLVSLLFATKAGLYWLDIVDHWVNDFNLIAIGVLECVAVGWIFGSGKLRKYANENTSFKLGAWWDVLIRFVTPIVLLYIAVSFIITNIGKPYGDYDQVYLIVGGWGMVALTVIAGFVLTFIKGKAAKEEKESE